MKMASAKTKILTGFLTVCMILSLLSITAWAADINYIQRIHVDYTYIEYKAGETPRTTAEVTEGECTVAYEYWREIHQEEAGSVWTGTGRYWYSDPDKMASLAADKRITKFEAGHTYSYNIVLAADVGYFIGRDKTVVSVGKYEWGTPGSSTNLAIKDTSKTLFIYSPYSITVPEDSNDKVITGVSVISVNKDLDSTRPVTFTAKASTWCADKFDVTEEAWEAAYTGNGSVNDIIKSTDSAPRAPIAGRVYWYSIVLTAKEGYVFSKDFSDKNCRIKEGSEVTFALGGFLYEGNFFVSDDGKTLTAWEFMDPVTAKGNTQNTIDKAVISDAKFNYQPGDVPQAGAKVAFADDLDKYEIVFESWEQMENGNPVAFWYSDDSQYISDMERITQFESGKSYMYSIRLRAKPGYTFDDNCPVTVNDAEVNNVNVIKTLDGLFVTAVKTITPQASGTVPDYKVVDGAGGVWTKNTDGTLTFRSNGDFSRFTGVKVDGNLISSDNYEVVPGSSSVTLKFGYLDTLADGMHTLTLVYSDGECSADFEIKSARSDGGTTPEKPDAGNTGAGKTPQTGDSNYVLWIALLLASGGVLIGMAIFTKRKNVSVKNK